MHISRKSFLRTAGLGTLGLFATESAAQPSGTAVQPPKGSARGREIADIQTFQFRKACYVQVITRDGQSGWGESDGANKKMTPLYVERVLKKHFIGHDPFNSEGLWQDAYLKELETGVGGLHPGSLAGIDNALWDLKGRILGLPTRHILGGNGKEKIRVYASYGRDRGNYDYRPPAEMAEIAADFVSQGYRAVKARMQIRQERVDPFPDDTFECVRAIREAIGPDVTLFVDFNNGYTPARATTLIRRLVDELDVAAVEEPVFQQDYAGLAQVVRDAEIPILAGEHEYSKWMFRDLIRADVDILNADVIKCGGLTECRKVAALAHAFGKPIMVHNAKPTLATAASLQLLGSIPNGARFQEYAGRRIHQGYGPLFELFENEFTFQDGFLLLNDEPGLGLRVREDRMYDRRINQD